MMKMKILGFSSLLLVLGVSAFAQSAGGLSLGQQFAQAKATGKLDSVLRTVCSRSSAPQLASALLEAGLTPAAATTALIACGVSSADATSAVIGAAGVASAAQVVAAAKVADPANARNIELAAIDAGADPTIFLAATGAGPVDGNSGAGLGTTAPPAPSTLGSPTFGGGGGGTTTASRS